MRSAKIQINLCIRVVWSEYLSGTVWISKDAQFLHAGNEDRLTGMHGCHKATKKKQSSKHSTKIYSGPLSACQGSWRADNGPL